MPRFQNSKPSMEPKTEPRASEQTDYSGPPRILQSILSFWTNRRTLARATLAAAGAVAFVTTYALILPAITLDQETADASPGLDREYSEAVSEEHTSQRPEDAGQEDGGETESSSPEDSWTEAAAEALDSLDEDSTPADRTAAVAQSQEGYQSDEETTSLYSDVLESDAVEGGGSFAAWCIDQAGVGEGFPVVAEDAAQWAQTLQEQDAVQTTATLWTEDAPSVGDVAFVSSQADGQADQAGIVTDVKTGLFGHTKAVEVTQENEDGQVESVTYKANDDRLCGYGVLPEEANEPEDAAGEEIPVETADGQETDAAVDAESAGAAETDGAADSGAEDTAETDAAADSDAEYTAETDAAAGSDAADTAVPEPAEAGDGSEPPADFETVDSENQAAEPQSEAESSAGVTDGTGSVLLAVREALNQAEQDPSSLVNQGALSPEELFQPAPSALETLQEMVAIQADYPNVLPSVTVDGVTVTAAYSDDALPDGTELVVTPVDETEYSELAAETAGQSSAQVKALDISFRCGG